MLLPPQSAGHSQSPKLDDPIHMLTALEPKKADNQSNEQLQLNIQNDQMEQEQGQIYNHGHYEWTLLLEITKQNHRSICCFVDNLTQNLEDTHLKHRDSSLWIHLPNR